jgi:two-component system cell cycle sensor histidine kinase/response regulator CckA
MFTEFLHPEDAPTDAKLFKELSIGCLDYYETEERIICRRGDLIWAHLNVSLVRSPEGEPQFVIRTLEDIAEHKRLEARFFQSQKMETVGRLAAGIAHDFNNHLTVIKGNSHLSLSYLKEGDSLKKNIQEILDAAERAENLTRQLLAFSRRQVTEMKVIDLNLSLRNLKKILHRIIGEDIELIMLLADDLGRIKTDPGQIENLVLNLAVNAREAMPGGGKLSLETANVELDELYAKSHISVIPGPYVRLSVGDTGCGMTPEVMEKIFEPFFTTKEKEHGTGLGLSTVYGIVKQSGGNIWVYSEPGYGTTFKIYLPRVREDADILASQENMSELPRGNETVLLVEDETSVRSLAAHVLREQGYNVLEAANGNEALQRMREYREKVQLLVTDVVMPQMGGEKLFEHLSAELRDLKALFISGYSDMIIRHHVLSRSDMPFLEKPFSPKALALKVRKVLDVN